MEEIFELIKAFNRLKEKIAELIAKVDLIAKNPLSSKEDEFLGETEACKFLRLSFRTMSRLRKEGMIPYVKEKRKVLYKKSDLLQYLEKTSDNLIKNI